jgi:Fanconi-associated nuclease 1
MNHYNDTPEQKENKMREATQICIDGLLDEDTHLSRSIPIALI